MRELRVARMAVGDQLLIKDAWASEKGQILNRDVAELPHDDRGARKVGIRQAPRRRPSITPPSRRDARICLFSEPVFRHHLRS